MTPKSLANIDSKTETFGVEDGLKFTTQEGRGQIAWRYLLGQALRETGGRKGDAAALLAIPRKRLYLRMKAVGLLAPSQK